MDIRTFEVDYDSIDAINKLRSSLQSRLNTLKGVEQKCRRETKQQYEERKKTTFEAYFSILDKDITSLYSDIKESLDPEEKYYVYAHLDPTKPISDAKRSKMPLIFAATFGIEYEPFYIGKGVDNRAFDLSRNETHRKIRSKCRSVGKDVVPFIIKDKLSEVDALILEAKLIDIFGSVVCGGLLVNIDDGHNSLKRKSIYKSDLEKINRINSYLLKDLNVA